MDAEARVQAVIDERSFTLEVETGGKVLEFECVIPNVMDLLDAGFDPILADITATDEQKQQAIDEQEKAISKDVRKFYPMAVKVLESSMVSPALWTGEVQDCPKGYVTPKYLGNLVFIMANELIGILTREAGEVGKATARFRMDTNGKDSAVSGSDVRDEPPGDTETPAA
jgi:hypothetical protein